MTDVRTDRVLIQVLLTEEYDPPPPVKVRADRVGIQALLTGPEFPPVMVRTDRLLVQALLTNTEPPPPPPPEGPPNDHFADAEVISGSSGTATGTNVNATLEVGEPSTHWGSGTKTIWYRFTAPEIGTVTIDTNGTGFDTVLELYAGASLGGLTYLTGDDDGGDGTNSRITWGMAAGQTINIRLNAFTGGVQGPTVLHWLFVPGGEEPPPPPIVSAGWRLGYIPLFHIGGPE